MEHVGLNFVETKTTTRLSIYNTTRRLMFCINFAYIFPERGWIGAHAFNKYQFSIYVRVYIENYPDEKHARLVCCCFLFSLDDEFLLVLYFEPVSSWKKQRTTG